MSNHYLENKPPSSRFAADRVLLFLKTQGPQSAANLGLAFETTGEAARQQLVKLAQEGWVVASETPNGVGRPKRVWSLTKAGHARFNDAHAELAVQLLQAIPKALGEGALQKLIAEREAETLRRYRTELDPLTPLEGRVSKLAALRNQEGYMVEWCQENHAFLLIENHCPIGAAAATCPGFCHSELNLFQEVLGPGVKVMRTEHILEGARRCAYRIEKH